MYNRNDIGAEKERRKLVHTSR